MTAADRDKWEPRYRNGSYVARTYPSELLKGWLPRLPPGRALDVACGAGRNALLLAATGYQVDAMDISATAVARGGDTANDRGLTINWLVVDLDVAPIAAGCYDLIVVARYVNRNLTERLIEALAPGGFLVYEHHLCSSQPVGGPSDPAFRLQTNELLRMFSPLQVVFYQEAIIDDPGYREMALAQLVACNGRAHFL